MATDMMTHPLFIYLFIYYFSTISSTRSLQSFAPAATMFYTDIQTLRGLDTPVDYGSGIEYADGLAQAFPEAGLQIGLWLNGTQGCRDIVQGNLDAQLHELFHFLLEKVDVPKIFLRVGYGAYSIYSRLRSMLASGNGFPHHGIIIVCSLLLLFLLILISEFDNPAFGYSVDPQVYRQAYRKVVKVCEQQLHSNDACHSKIAFCWHSWAAPKVAPLHYFYPGDDVVDWIGISIFQQLYPWANTNENDDDDSSSSSSSYFGNHFAGGDRKQVKEVLEFAKRRDKPIMIAESTPFGGIYLKDEAGSSVEILNDNVDIWELWFQPTLDLIHQYDIGMWSYIDCDWNAQPMWKGVGFGDTRLSISSNVMDRWHKQVLSDDSRFTNQLECGRRSSSHDYQKDHSLLPFASLLDHSSWSHHHHHHPAIRVLYLVAAAVVLVLIKQCWCTKRTNKTNMEYQPLEGDDASVEWNGTGYGSVEDTNKNKTDDS
jgi:hypothetical protein